jgi:steroid delta-isomerase-like uncharacterized protein
MIVEDEASTNKARRREFVKAVQGDGQLDRLGEFIADDIVDHNAMAHGPDGIAGVKAILGAIRSGFPDHDAEIVHLVAEGDLVATYKTFTGTNTGSFFGMPATGKRATIRVMDFVRCRDGKVTEHWNIVDMAGLMEQLKG